MLHQALVRHPGEGVDLAEVPGQLAPGIARIGAAEDLAVDAAGQQKIGLPGPGWLDGCPPWTLPVVQTILMPLPAGLMAHHTPGSER